MSKQAIQDRLEEIENACDDLGRKLELEREHGHVTLQADKQQMIALMSEHEQLLHELVK